MNASTKGQSLAEYALILALVAVASVGGLNALGSSIQGTFGTAGTAIAGVGSTTPQPAPVVDPIAPGVGNPLQSTPAQTFPGGPTDQSLNPSETFAPPPEIR